MALHYNHHPSDLHGTLLLPKALPSKWMRGKRVNRSKGFNFFTANARRIETHSIVHGRLSGPLQQRPPQTLVAAKEVPISPEECLEVVKRVVPTNIGPTNPQRIDLLALTKAVM